MECIKIEHLSFTYPDREHKALDDISTIIHAGEFVTICGKSGCGKTTLLRLLKSSLSPFGTKEGSIFFLGLPLSHCDTRMQASKIGFVMQNPDNQIVTDKVWHELAFGLESLGYPTQDIRTRVSEMASFFGIETWFHKNVSELSGGQKQQLNLASVMVLEPSVLILDEPTSQLDPIAAQEFLKTLEKINRELGIAVVLTEHRLEETFPLSDRVIVMDEGKIIADDTPREVGKILKASAHDMCSALPVPMRIYSSLPSSSECPLNVREGRKWLEAYAQEHELFPEVIPDVDKLTKSENEMIEIKDVWFRYKRNMPDVVKGLNLSVYQGEILAILGGNGTGKTTALSLISGLNMPYRGEIRIKGKLVHTIPDLYNGILSVLPQNPQTLFVKKTLYQDLSEMLSSKNTISDEQDSRVRQIASLCKIDHLLESHPYDLSGGEQQRAALAKVLLLSPKILLLDEPTKGIDAHFKKTFAEILHDLKSNGVTIIMVSHDIEFCAEFADRCAMFFDGNIASIASPRAFFAGKKFYTTSANRIAGTTLPKAILAEDIILACSGTIPPSRMHADHIAPHRESFITPEKKEPTKEKKHSPSRIIVGCIFLLLFLLTSVECVMKKGFLHLAEINLYKPGVMQFVSIIELAISLLCFFPNQQLGIQHTIQYPETNRRLSKRTIFATILILLAIPLTIYIGAHVLDDRKYYFISLLIILEAMIPFALLFEDRIPKARELVIISVLCAIAVAGRTLFLALPQFKPVIALIIISGVCFGGETGFLVGAVTGFVSNFFFGQGPWTPWQMFSLGIIGFFAGILFQKGFLKTTKLSLCIYGIFATIGVYGGIMNPASIIMMQSKITTEMILFAYIRGLPFDLMHAMSTVFFLWFISEPMIGKLERIKVKYGLVKM